MLVRNRDRNAMELKNGQFFKNGVVVPVEFGNEEQIKLLKEQGIYLDKLRNGLELNPISEISVTYTDIFKCFCGLQIFLENESEREDDEECLSEITRKCRCGKHTFKTYMECGSLMVKEIEHAPQS